MGSLVLEHGPRLAVMTVMAATEAAALETGCSLKRAWRQKLEPSLFHLYDVIEKYHYYLIIFMSNKIFLKKTLYSFTFLTVLLFLIFEQEPHFYFVLDPQNYIASLEDRT